MKELFFRNAVSALIPMNADGEEALRQYPNGVTLRVKVVQPRSLPHHNFYHAFTAEVFEQWPDDHGFPPKDVQHLRAWLLVKAGFSEGVAFDSGTKEEAEFAVLVLSAVVTRLAKGKPYWPKVTNTRDGVHIEVRWPQSISFENMDEEEFRRASNLVFAVVYAETGLDVEEHYRAYLEKHPALKVVPTRRIDGRATGNSPEDQARRF